MASLSPWARGCPCSAGNSVGCNNPRALHRTEYIRRNTACAYCARLGLDLATLIEDMRAPPGNRLESLRADRAGQWSVRINDQWRLCFRFEDGDAWDVEIVD